MAARTPRATASNPTASDADERPLVAVGGAFPAPTAPMDTTGAIAMQAMAMRVRPMPLGVDQIGTSKLSGASEPWNHIDPRPAPTTSALESGPRPAVCVPFSGATP